MPSTRRQRAKRRQRRGVLLGRYHHGTNGQGACIELIVDTMVGGIPRGFAWLQLSRDVTVGRTLYHEIGHHLDATIGSRSRDGERSAEAWRSRLIEIHARRRYGYLKPFARPLAGVFRILARHAKRRGST